MSVPLIETQYEKELKRLGLQRKSLRILKASKKLKEWATSHASTKYVPEVLLDRWGLSTAWE